MSNPRMSITFTKPQMTFIKRRSKTLAVSEAELVRQLVGFAIAMVETQDQRGVPGLRNDTADFVKAMWPATRGSKT